MRGLFCLLPADSIPPPPPPHVQGHVAYLIGPPLAIRQLATRAFSVPAHNAVSVVCGVRATTAARTTEPKPRRRRKRSKNRSSSSRPRHRRRYSRNPEATVVHTAADFVVGGQRGLCPRSTLLFFSSHGSSFVCVVDHFIMRSSSPFFVSPSSGTKRGSHTHEHISVLSRNNFDSCPFPVTARTKKVLRFKSPIPHDNLALIPSSLSSLGPCKNVGVSPRAGPTQ